MRVRWLAALGVIVILIVLPALSWYYLNQGADWRRAGLAEMADKKPFEYEELDLANVDGEMIRLEPGMFIIATKLEATTAARTETLNKIAEQFDHQPDLQFLYFGTQKDGLAEDWTVVDCASSDCNSMTMQLFAGNSNAALIDDSLYIRSVYDLASNDEAQKLAEHGAILFPVEKRKKIELKRGVNQ